MNMNFEDFEKLEQIEASALEEYSGVTPLEQNESIIETSGFVEEPQMEMSSCICMGGCGSNYSISNSCACMGGCGSNYHK